MSKECVQTKQDNNLVNGTLNTQKNIPLDSRQNIPLALLGQCVGGDGVVCRRRRYTSTTEVEKLAVEKYKKNGKGITFNDLISCGVALHKEQAQTTLKHCLRSGDLFTISPHKPQEYYPTCLRAEILKHKMSKNIPVGVTGVGYSRANILDNGNNNGCSGNNSNNKNSSSAHCIEFIPSQSLEGYILPLLPAAPLHIHRMQFWLKVVPGCYNVLDLPQAKGNKAKEHVEVIGKVRVSYNFYSNGTVMVFTQSSNNPFRLEDETDRSRLIAFLGQVRDRLIMLLADRHERIVPDIMDWHLTQCELNKDILIGHDWLQFTGLNIQVRHLDHIFRIYIKSQGKDAVCRVEQSVSGCCCSKVGSSAAAVDAINSIFNPSERVENRLMEIERKLDKISSSVNDSKNSSAYGNVQDGRSEV